MACFLLKAALASLLAARKHLTEAIKETEAGIHFDNTH
jgi:hypothetical protein